jgi:hypothetical protein
MLGFQGFWTARRTLAGVEAMAMLAKVQVRAVPANDRRSGPSSTGSSAWRLDRGDALRQLAYGQPTQQILSGCW